jgi:YD repeat-containing protein
LPYLLAWSHGYSRSGYADFQLNDLATQLANYPSFQWPADGRFARDAGFDFYVVPMPQTGSTTRIVFTSNRDGRAQLYSMDAGGGSLIRLTNNGANDDHPRWSPNGTKILFQSDRDNLATGTYDIYVMNANGTGQTRLTVDAADDCNAVWSPDGSKIVFQSLRNGSYYQIYTMNADGTNQVNITNGISADSQPSWSPDGLKITFASERDHVGTPSVYVMNVNGSNQTRLTFSSEPFRDEQPVWSPDSSRIAFVSTRDSVIDTWQETDDNGGMLTRTAVRTNKEVYVMNANGTGQARLTNTLENDDSPGWSPDGTKIIFRSDRERDSFDPTQQLWVMSADGGNQALITSNGFGDYSASWNETVNQPPVAQHGGPYGGTSCTAIQFNGSNSSDADGAITSYQWSFGDGTSGTGATVSHIYTTPGTRTVALTVTDNNGAQASASTTATIANCPPVANAGGPYNGVTNTAIQFNGGGSSDPDGSITSYQWNFGDGTSGTGVTVSHTYTTIGTRTVTLTVTDNNGAQASASTTATISNQPPVANTGGPYSGVVAQNIPFSASGSYDPDGSIASYSWNFGDGGTASGFSLTHTYSSPGTYPVTLTVTDNLGAQTSATTTASITTAASEQYLANFNQAALARPPYQNESTYWNDILRAAYPNGQSSMLLAVRELGKTLFESSDYAARGRDNHGYVYDLYKTYLMREPDPQGWAFWESVCNSNGRDNVRRAFDECGEFAGIVATLTPSGSPSSNVSSLASARVDPFNQPGNGLAARDAEWSVSLLSLPGRAGLDLGLSLSYSSMIWTHSGPYIYFDEDNGWPSPGFRLGFPTIQEKVFDAQAGRNVYLLLSGGSRVSLRQLGASNVYEAADSSYLQLIDNGGSLLLRTTDGTQLSYQSFNNEWRCTQIKDRNGNYISVNYDWLGHITTIIDTLARTITCNYDTNANLLSITQSWTVNGAPTTHTWASFGWTTTTVQPSFSGVMAVGASSPAIIPVLSQVGLDDGSHYTFEYNTLGQVNPIRSYRSDNVQRAYTAYDYDTPADDCPRLIDTHVWAENWTGLNGVPQEVATIYGAPGDGSHTVTTPDGTLYKEFYGSGWQRGLTTQTEIWSGGVRQKWTVNTFTQDNTGVNYQTNPRVTETNVFDASGNRRRATVSYAPFTLPSGASCPLPSDTCEYAGDATTILRRTHVDYRMDPTLDAVYLDRHIIGLVKEQTLYEVNGGAETMMSKAGTAYDEAGSILGNDAPVGHDNSYDGNFVSGRANLSSVKRYDVTISDNSVYTVSSVKYNTAGAVVLTSDPLNHHLTVSYADSFSAEGTNLDAPRSFATLAFPTTVTDADGHSSYVRYHYDLGAKTRAQGPPPENQTQGLIQIFAYDAAARIERVTTTNNGAYRSFVYGPNYVQSYATVNNIADEAYVNTVFDGMGRTVVAASNHPGVIAGRYSAVNTLYDRMGRSVKQSNPTETNGAWVPGGDDAGWLYMQQTYDWKGRPLVTTNTDGTTKEASYSGCGCAGGAVVTLTDEGTIDGGVTKRQQQKIYSDVLGRTVKTEILNWQGGSPYSTTINNYNARDQVTRVRQFDAGQTVPSDPNDLSCPSGSCQQTTLTYDGYGRLKTKHIPEQDANTATTYNYNPDDTTSSVVDARGTASSFTYNAHRQVKHIAYEPSAGVPDTADVTFAYDAAGNRISMTDGPGSCTYNYDQLSRMTSETRTFNGIGTYPITYDYNLAGELKTIIDPWGATLNYGFDSAGRLSNITGTGYAVSQFLSSAQYRAWGSLKSETYGNGFVESAAYNSRLQMTGFQVNNAAGQAQMSRTYQYYANANLKFSSNAQDERFDRAFSFDQLGRTAEAYAGSEARDFINGTNSGLPSGPYRQSYQYNAYNQVTQETNRLWNYNEMVTSVYSNNRKENWSYDANGSVSFDDSTGYTHDAAALIVQAANDVSSALNKFDGNGRMVATTSTHPHFHSTITTTTYYLNSTVLGGLAVAELYGSGQRSTRYVYAGGRKLAEVFVNDAVYWAHQDPVTGSRGDSTTGNSYFAKAEFNADGIDVGFEEPQATGFEEAQPILWTALGEGSNCSFNDPNCKTCYLDGFEHRCGDINWEAAEQCPNNDCGPRLAPDAHGNPVLTPLTRNPNTGQLGYWPNGPAGLGLIPGPMGNPTFVTAWTSGHGEDVWQWVYDDALSQNVFVPVPTAFSGSEYFENATPQNASHNPNCIEGAVEGGKLAGRGLEERISSITGPSGFPIHDGDHVLVPAGTTARVTALPLMAGSILHSGRQTADRTSPSYPYSVVDILLNTRIDSQQYVMTLKDMFHDTGKLSGNVNRGGALGSVEGNVNPNAEAGLHVTLYPYSIYKQYIQSKGFGPAARNSVPFKSLMSAGHDPRSPFRCP